MTDQTSLEADARELAGLARYHAMHADVSKGDRAKIAELCDRIEGYDAEFDSLRIREALAMPTAPATSRGELATHPCDGCGAQTSEIVCPSCSGTTNDPRWCGDCNGVCQQREMCSPMRSDNRASAARMLWDANPDCAHEIYFPSGGGFACRKCPGWHCA